MVRDRGWVTRAGETGKIRSPGGRWQGGEVMVLVSVDGERVSEEARDVDWSSFAHL